MTKYLEDIRKKIEDNIDAEHILLIDNSYLHTKHKSFDENKFHLKIVITSQKLSKMKKVEAHKMIFSLLSEEM
ncbi:BolA/IbaG family iron-sulfur metabolism protein, partial [Pelagibacteraceae bacterium]|nr:BolA/IbaG family iron-sulfur metabolism protein [Pelagibacteraceae bacterium]